MPPASSAFNWVFSSSELNSSLSRFSADKFFWTFAKSSSFSCNSFSAFVARTSNASIILSDWIFAIRIASLASSLLCLNKTSFCSTSNILADNCWAKFLTSSFSLPLSFPTFCASNLAFSSCELSNSFVSLKASKSFSISLNLKAFNSDSFSAISTFSCNASITLSDSIFASAFAFSASSLPSLNNSRCFSTSVCNWNKDFSLTISSFKVLLNSFISSKRFFSCS